ncbi:MAG: hypothetical protein K2F70_02110, partial [Muribaculaceae bacterium]|nr:hypothetical protein [Muribaculaceae bacterium]
MKKTLVTLSLAVVTLFGFNAFAQQQDQQQCKKDKTEKCCRGQKTEKCSKGDRRGEFNPFEGIQLSTEQQSKLEAMKQEFKVERQKMKEEFKKDENKVRPDRKEIFQKRREAARERLNKVKHILTPEQYENYLENIAVN